MFLLTQTGPALSTIPTILVTAQGIRHDEAWLIGADGYLSKPFTGAELMNIIQEVLIVVRTRSSRPLDRSTDLERTIARPNTPGRAVLLATVR